MWTYPGTFHHTADGIDEVLQKDTYSIRENLWESFLRWNDDDNNKKSSRLCAEQ